MDLDRAPLVTPFWWLVGHILLWPPARLLARLRVSGRENLPAEGAVLIVSNHVSQADPPTMGIAALPRRQYYMAKQELFRVPVLGFMIHKLGAFPIDRGGADRRALRIAKEILARGDMLLMFPEGHRHPDGRLHPGLPGAGTLGLEPGVTVVPAAIWGSQKPTGPARVVFGAPLDLSDLAGGPRSRRSQEAVDRMMAAIAELLPLAGGPAQEAPTHRTEPVERLDG
jgi:1-acyl-sn-glycerol-3-phosphate acyltransferase